MKAASAPGPPARLLVIDAERRAHADARPSGLARFFVEGDLLVVNDAATLPASLPGRAAGGDALEIRLLSSRGGPAFLAVLLGAGDWRTRTEHRPPPPRLEPGAVVSFDGGLSAIVEGHEALSPRLVRVRFDREGAPLLGALYAIGRPIQYAHVPEPLELWSVQTGYASRPWAVEMPSAGRPLTFELILALRRAGVGIATLTHAAGVSATGDPAIDAALPLPERFEIPAATVAAIEDARWRGGRIVAVGTSVVRALEGAHALHGAVVSGEGETDLVLRAGSQLHVVDGLLTGMHERDASHFALLQAFVPLEVIERAYEHAEAEGYRGHEFGDATLLLPLPQGARA